MAAAEKFKTPENPAGLGGEVSSTVSQPIPEESEDEGEVMYPSLTYICQKKLF